MHTVNLRKVGGSIMLAVPPPLLNLLKLGAGDPVNIGIENGRLIVQPKVGPKCALDQLLPNATGSARPPMRIVPGLTTNLSVKSSCSEARRHLARRP